MCDLGVEHAAPGPRAGASHGRVGTFSGAPADRTARSAGVLAFLGRSRHVVTKQCACCPTDVRKHLPRWASGLPRPVTGTWRTDGDCVAAAPRLVHLRHSWSRLSLEP